MTKSKKTARPKKSPSPKKEVPNNYMLALYASQSTLIALKAGVGSPVFDKHVRLALQNLGKAIADATKRSQGH